MSHHDVVVIGGGLGGVTIAAFHLAQGKDVALIEPGALAGSFIGGLKYMRDSVGFRRLLSDVKVDYAIRPVMGGILRADGMVAPFPGDLSPDQLFEVQRAHYQKTRGTADGFTTGAMNFGGGGAQLLFDVPELVEYVEQRARIVDRAVKRISGKMVSTGGQWIEGAEIISTIPLPALCAILGLEARESPICKCEMLFTAHVDTLEGGAASAFPYDYVYTPWLPVAHRLSKDGDRLLVEWNERLGDARDDMKSIGMDFESKPTKMPGHLHPAVWGSVKLDAGLFCGIRLAGRFAEWLPRRTVDQTLDQLYGEPHMER